MKNEKEKFMKGVFFAAACTSIIAVILICIFLFAGGVPAMKKIGFFNFLLGTKWKPSNDMYGIMPMILGSIFVTAGAIIIGVPIGILTAVFMAKYCPKKIYGVLKASTELLAGIPSVVYGFFGLVIMVPFVRNVFGGDGNSMLTASMLLGIMILPTIIGISESALRAVPREYCEGALALGATKERSIFRVTLPAAKSGIFAAVVLGIGRAIGETMAVIMVAGNQPGMPSGILKGVRTLTSNIVMEMGYAADLHREALIATSVILFIFILIINVAVAIINRRSSNNG
ncbi:phosphate transport system permease protein [Hathewaya proteolytica DSM 3090]|uniref:Phosphate transport system permease protein n=1 Tax=Hathewaya proteolytica DSM 3090 TaxID=1121331 RepID=A0A1M6PVQ6_9CLOT|nr:phosphate ABC transporter permease subunit PstC [Hathewaya proteolytica]SHK12019.1 phosphate transport system permease protein [Hathewaya proteolytica DSM 3090]